MSDRIVMGYWDCPYCESKGIPGTTYDCPNCGRQRGKETKFYMKPGKVEYIQGHKVVGADWYCAYCGALNTAGKTVCENCGSQKDESKDDYFSLKKKETVKQPEPPKPTRPAYKPKRKLRNNFWFKLIRAGVIFLAILYLISLIKEAARPKDCTFEVQNLTWENSIEVEEYKTFRESDWSVPSGGRLVYTTSEIRRYDSVLDHYEPVTKSRQVESGGHYDYSYTDNGDGTFTEHSTYVPEYTTEYYTEDEPVYVNVPVYDTKYYYDIDKWVHERTERTNGNDKNPYWPELNLSDKEREGSRSSKYKMEGVLNYKTFGHSKKKETSFAIREDWWKSIESGQTLSVTLNGNSVTEWHKVK